MVLPVSYANSALPAALVRDAVGGSRLEAVRRTIEAVPLARSRVIDRASCSSAVLEDAALAEVLAEAASAVTGRALRLASARIVRLEPGDYVLTRADRVYEDRPVEVVLDVSRAAVPGAEVHYRHRGQVFFVVPSSPGALAVVERGPTVLANHTYVSKRQAGVVLRIVALLR